MTETDDTPEATYPRRIRSFVRRTGRVTRAQARALDSLWHRFGASAEQLGALDLLFGRSAPRYLEVGFGMGDALASMATDHPQRDYLGVEVHEAGIGRLLCLAEAAGLENLRVVRGDVISLLGESLEPSSLDAVLIFFPDPWPKKRHHKRRLVQPPLMPLLARCLRPGGKLHLATDWTPYAEQMLEVVQGHGAFRNLAGAGCYAKTPDERPVTKFQRRGERLGHTIHDLIFRLEDGVTEA